MSWSRVAICSTVKRGKHSREAPLTHLAPSEAIRGERYQRPGESAAICGPYQDSTATLAHHLPYGREVARDDGTSLAHRFEQY